MCLHCLKMADLYYSQYNYNGVNDTLRRIFAPLSVMYHDLIINPSSADGPGDDR